MALKVRPDPEIVALKKAVRARLEGMGPFDTETRDGIVVYMRDGEPFVNIQTKRDHMVVDLWLQDEAIGDARSSGIARAHPFLGENAIKIRFERAVDLARVARWIEHSYRWAPQRAEAAAAAEDGDDEASSGRAGEKKKTFAPKSTRARSNPTTRTQGAVTAQATKRPGSPQSSPKKNARSS